MRDFPLGLVLRMGLRGMVGRPMTFGYIGYIWTLMGCGGLALVFGTSAAVLYGVSRRNRDMRKEPRVQVESVPLTSRRDPRA